ncbi:MAG TPA: tetratricopeptide repeat protein [Saprospiraceae bacterium]|nr:tetratricopeptide repeat protein [Saprospiraceae bacterium]HPN69281.1 tetratricopeptide repeat protein [Saprospiraceae bacterium]
MFYKAIIQGRLDFGTPRSFETVVKMFNYRVENYHKNDILFKVEEIFNEETNELNIERFVGNVLEKSFKSTSELLDYCVQFAVNGSIRAWLVDNGEILHFHLMEPASDKAAVQSYIRGRSLVKVAGRQDEAIEELSRAIEKYDKHAQAYERRAKTCFIMKKYGDAMRDYNKSLGIDPTIPSAYYGRARVHLINNDLEAAVADFDQAIKKSVALEPIHWKSRRLKGETHIKLKQYLKAIFELKLFTKRAFKDEDSNKGWKRWAFYNYGIALLENENNEEAIEAFNSALALPEVSDGIQMADILRNRGLAKKKSGKNGYIKDIKEAASLGDALATSLLQQIK